MKPAELQLQDSDHVRMGEGIRRRAATRSAPSVAVAVVAGVLLPAALLVAAPAGTLAATTQPVAGPNPPGGGSAAPDGEGGSEAGDVRLQRALVRLFRVVPHALTPGQAASFTLRVSSHRSGLRARVELRRTGSRRVIRVSLGRIQTGRSVHVRWTGTRRLTPGVYVARVVVIDRYGDRARALGVASRAHLRVVAPTPPPAPTPAPAPSPAPSPAPTPPPGDTAFPIAGPHDYGGPDSRFGASRGDHIHQGQDVAAAEGTPLVAPRPGTITTVDYQAGGAGYYVVEADDDGMHWYALMHLEAGSTVVSEGEHVSVGQRLGSVGATGDATGPHLHFEEWIGPWQAGGHPVDPLPLLQSWDH
jgi:murein DD-endopeptidase MepM/ murein hydrolase activator NlpD